MHANYFRAGGVRYSAPGDHACYGDEGRIVVLGRGLVCINSGGEKIYPEEVEAALKGHPDVFDALVVGVPDERYGQCVAAVVQPRDGTRPTLADLDTFVRAEIAGYKVPRALWYVDEVMRIITPCDPRMVLLRPTDLKRNLAAVCAVVVVANGVRWRENSENG